MTQQQSPPDLADAGQLYLHVTEEPSNTNFAVADELTQRAYESLPPGLAELIQSHGLFVCGGLMRSLLLGVEPHDTDIFGPNAEAIEAAIMALTVIADTNPNVSVCYETDNAVTFAYWGSTVQIVRRDPRPSLIETITSFDFTIGMAGFLIDESGMVQKAVTQQFLVDTANFQLRYNSPVRNENHATAMRRMVKFIRMGFNPDFRTMAAVASRLTWPSVDPELNHPSSEAELTDELERVLESSRMSGLY